MTGPAAFGEEDGLWKGEDHFWLVSALNLPKTSHFNPATLPSSRFKALAPYASVMSLREQTAKTDSTENLVRRKVSCDSLAPSTPRSSGCVSLGQFPMPPGHGKYSTTSAMDPVSELSSKQRIKELYEAAGAPASSAVVQPRGTCASLVALGHRLKRRSCETK